MILAGTETSLDLQQPFRLMDLGSGQADSLMVPAIVRRPIIGPRHLRDCQHLGKPRQKQDRAPVLSEPIHQADPSPSQAM